MKRCIVYFEQLRLMCVVLQITPMILSKLGQNLHLNKNHPLSIIKGKVEEYCNVYAAENGQSKFKVFDSLSPIVSTAACFDSLLIGEDHVSRKSTDTYYINDTTVFTILLDRNKHL